MHNLKILTILGTRPEIIKLSPLIVLLNNEFNHKLVHTGQHYLYELDEIFFKELCLNKPNYNLAVGSEKHAKQTAKMLIKIEKILFSERPDLVIVFGDTNSTLAGALASSKLKTKLIHIEAGCRSFNRKMPEEINRIIVDHIGDYLFAPDEISIQNLNKEGLYGDNVFLTGSLIYDACLRNSKLSKSSNIINQLKLTSSEYLLATIHRAENTDNLDTLKEIIKSFNIISQRIHLVIPIHPRTKRIIEKENIELSDKISVLDSVGYLDFLELLTNSIFIMTDSGGIQEEACILNVPCLVIRKETEWMRYVNAGKNILIGTKKEKIVSTTFDLLNNREKIDKIKSIKINFNKNVSEKIVKIIKDLTC